MPLGMKYAGALCQFIRNSSIITMIGSSSKIESGIVALLLPIVENETLLHSQ